MGKSHDVIGVVTKTEWFFEINTFIRIFSLEIRRLFWRILFPVNGF
jgi:hypothetical protein